MDAAGGTVMLLATIAIAIFIFLLCRAIMLWYWKIDEHIANQKKIIDLLTKIESNTQSETPIQEIPRPAAYSTPLTRH